MSTIKDPKGVDSGHRQEGLKKADSVDSLKEKQSQIEEKAKIARSKVNRRKLNPELIKGIVSQISDNKRVRKFFDPWGRITIDRQLPFLCVYRKREGHSPGDEKLVMGEAAFIAAGATRGQHRHLKELVSSLSQSLSEKFGAYLIIELWTTPYSNTEDMAASPAQFKIYRAPKGYPQLDTQLLESELKKVKVQKQSARVITVYDKKPCPDDCFSLVSPKEAERNNIFILGIEIADVYRDADTARNFPEVKKLIWRGLSSSLKRYLYNFTKDNTTYRPPNYKALGKRKLLKAVWEIDSQLAMVNQAFDLILAVTPTNTKEAFEEFKRKKFESEPKFLYRPIAVELNELKKLLFSVNVNRVEDPAMIHLFEEQQRGLEIKINLLDDRGTDRFLYGSMQLYGKPKDELVQVARHLLAAVPTRTKGVSQRETVSAKEFSLAAQKELDFYRKINPQFNATVEIVNDIAGVMVSHGHLLVSAHSRVPKSRVNALIQHEIGTHVLTYFNGSNQPFKQLCTGFVGYDELQEGLAVVSEFLCDGLNQPRLRMLAGRVVAVQMLIDGATFIETYRELVYRFRFKQLTAFNLVTRVYRGGGFTKDAVYLRGLIWLLDYFGRGGDFDSLFVGKLPKEQIPLIGELLWRNVVKPPLLMPRYLKTRVAQQRLISLKNGITIAEVSKSAKSH